MQNLRRSEEMLRELSLLRYQGGKRIIEASQIINWRDVIGCFRWMIERHQEEISCFDPSSPDTWGSHKILPYERNNC